MTPKYAAKVDANQPEMVSAIRATGSANALHIHMVGGGAPDIVVGCKNGFTVVGPDAALLLNHLRDYVRLSLKLGILFTSEIYEGANLLVEIKDGEKVPSAQKLTPDEEEFHASWPGQIDVWNSIDAALEGMGYIQP
jgi:hypothetical protein